MLAFVRVLKMEFMVSGCKIELQGKAYKIGLLRDNIRYERYWCRNTIRVCDG